MLPTPAPLLEDELLFSGLGRLAGLNGLIDTRGALAHMTGGRGYSVSADLPCHLESILDRVGADIMVRTIDEIIEHHTQFPYYRFFSPWGRWLRVREIAVSHEAGRLKATMGILAHGIRATPVLRYCAVCAWEVRGTNGPFVWYRSHNLPGVVACARHRCLLKETWSQVQQGHRARLWMAPEPSHVDPVLATPAQCELAQVSRDVLCHTGTHLTAQTVRSTYLSAVERRGWTRGNGRPDWERLAKVLKTTFGPALEPDLAARFLLDRPGTMAWIRDLLSSRERVVPPLSHVMLICVLFDSVERFVDACNGRWDEKVATATSAPNAPPLAAEIPTRFERATKAILDISRSCREVAKSFGVSVGWVVKQRRIAGSAIHERPKALNGVRIAKVRALLASGESVAAVARRSKLSLSTIYRVLSTTANLVESRAGSAFQRALMHRRAEWLRLRGEQPDVGTTSLRAVAPACYAWLYRNDRAWLESSRPSRAHGTVTSRVDWEMRDAQLAQRVAGLQPPPCALARRMKSAAGVASLVYPPSSLQKHLDKLPRFAAAAEAKAAAAT